MARATVKEVQTQALEIYKAIKDICDRHNLSFFAIGGTAIGAVRHQGFIPWDDDLDIAMPADDYFRFIDKYSKELPPHLQLILPCSSENNSRSFCKVHDTRTTLILADNLKTPDMYYGIFVDIMPLYGIPEPYGFYDKYIYFLRTMDRLQRRQYRFFREKSKAHALFWLITKPVNLLFPNHFWHHRCNAFLTKYTFKNCTKTGYSWSKRIKKKNVFPIEWFKTKVTVPFEDSEMYLPVGYDAMLNQQFGDYMTPLPPDEQSNHMSEGIADVCNSYLDYVKEFENTGSVHQH